jgi:hypothetical protein
MAHTALWVIILYELVGAFAAVVNLTLAYDHRAAHLEPTPELEDYAQGKVRNLWFTPLWPWLLVKGLSGLVPWRKPFPAGHVKP